MRKVFVILLFIIVTGYTVTALNVSSSNALAPNATLSVAGTRTKRKKNLPPSDDLQPYCDWRLTTDGCRNGWIHESILGVDWTLSQHDRDRLHDGIDYRLNSSRRFTIFRRLIQYTHCTMRRSTSSSSSKQTHCVIHGSAYWMRIIPSPVDGLLLGWTSFGLFRLVSVTIILLGFVENSAVQEAIFDVSLWPAIIGAVTFVVGVVGRDPPKRLMDCAGLNGPRKRWIHQPAIWYLQLMTFFHIICFPIATLIFSIMSGLQANVFNVSLTMKWDSLALFTWSTQAWVMAIVGGAFAIECLRVAITRLNKPEIKYLYQLTHIYGIIAGAGTIAGLWTLMSGLLPPRSLNSRLSTPMLKIVNMPESFHGSKSSSNDDDDDNDYSRRPWTMKEPSSLSSLILVSNTRRDQLTTTSSYYDRASYSDYPTIDNASTKRNGHRSTIAHSRHQSSRSYFSTRTVDLQPPSPMRPPPIALQRGDRHMTNYTINNEITNNCSSSNRRYSSNTTMTNDQTSKRALVDGQGLRVSAVGVRPCSLLSRGTENQEGRVNTASDYMSPRGSFSSGDGRGYIIEMYSVEESAYIDREIADSCDSRLRIGIDANTQQQ
ncbi:hypothetical protein BDF22DRAFT_739757 [Syncephalis plumigaleata]|nr:hypothetical protein BDF22DRAFT_739757 [Syncephalis plumigaleata]